ncbi:competence type IV pilus major pilin ComGC [Niallia sp. 01092]|uniref:competence type IV pilus major pilin ComGC n=1 Tax=unclassified Niallia TaxID=2837522 RepID=UPI003FD4F7F7
MKNEKGFTLIEMMIVLLVISILLLITIPNVTKHNSKINKTGCDAFVKMAQAEVQSYYMDNQKYPTDMEALADAGYVQEGQTTCPNGKAVVISSSGEVSVASTP